MKPKVSIIIPVYKAEKYFERCLRSLFEQTMDDLEYVFVDDGSPDDSMGLLGRVLEEYPKRKEQVVIVRHEQNKGIAIARKVGLLATTGEYVLYVDADDSVDARMARLMYDKARESGAEMVVCDYYCVKEGRLYYSSVDKGNVDDEDLTYRVRWNTINRDCAPNIWLKMVRRDLYLHDDVVWPVGGSAEDVLLSAELVLLAGKIAIVREPLYYYYINPGSFVHDSSEEQCVLRFNGCKGNMDILIDYFEKRGLAEEYHVAIFRAKAGTRAALTPLLGKRKYRKMLLSTYPEMNRAFLFGDGVLKPSYRERLWMIAIITGLYPLVGRLFDNKRFKVRFGWR